jgi:hypothetical protein
MIDAREMALIHQAGLADICEHSMVVMDEEKDKSNKHSPGKSFRYRMARGMIEVVRDISHKRAARRT